MNIIDSSLIFLKMRDRFTLNDLLLWRVGCNTITFYQGTCTFNVIKKKKANCLNEINLVIKLQQ